MNGAEYYQPGWRETIEGILLIVAMVVIATVVAFIVEQAGMTLMKACIFGASNGFLVIWLPYYLHAQIQMAKMRRTSGFPFADGQRVAFSCGPLEGQQGVIQFRGQAVTTYVLEMDGHEHIDNWLTIEHKYLRALESAHESNR